MRGRPAEVDLCRRRTAKTLMRAKVRVVNEAELDLLHQILRHQRPQQAEAERVLQRPPQAFDQCDRALLSDCPEPLLHTEPSQLPAEDLAREAASLIRDEVRRPSMALRRPRHEASDLGRGLKWIEVCALGARAMTKPLVCARQCARQFPLPPYTCSQKGFRVMRPCRRFTP